MDSVNVVSVVDLVRDDDEPHIPSRSIRDRSNPLENFNAEEIRQRFRFHKMVVIALLNLI